MTTQWAHITRIGWAQAVGIEPASDLIAWLLDPGRGADHPARPEDWRRRFRSAPSASDARPNFVAAPRPSALFTHPTPHQMKQMTLSTLTADQAFVILWSDQPHIRRLAYSAAQPQPRSDRRPGPPRIRSSPEASSPWSARATPARESPTATARTVSSTHFGSSSTPAR